MVNGTLMDSVELNLMPKILRNSNIVYGTNIAVTIIAIAKTKKNVNFQLGFRRYYRVRRDLFENICSEMYCYGFSINFTVGYSCNV